MPSSPWAEPEIPRSEKMGKALSLVHAVREPGLPSGTPPPLILLLHGVGSNEEDLMGLAPELGGAFLCASARGPYALGGDAYAWFHVEFAPNGPVIRPEEAEESRLRLLGFVDELVDAYGADPERVYLMGFSQGAIMGLGIALTRPDKVAGVVAMSGRILPEALKGIREPERLKGLPAFVAHGTMDGVIPIAAGRETRDRLSELGLDLDYREYPMGHEITRRSLADISAWLGKKSEK
jgi:phospholipase/carboxylesterase